MISLSLLSRLAAHGFTLQGTGGNCTAFVRYASDGAQEMITEAPDGNAPDRLGAPIVISDYPADGDECTSIEGYTLADVLRALDHPSRDYALLSLRLLNNLHTEQ